MQLGDGKLSLWLLFFLSRERFLSILFTGGSELSEFSSLFAIIDFLHPSSLT